MAKNMFLFKALKKIFKCGAAMAAIRTTIVIMAKNGEIVGTT